jgi:NAD(P) transhydrogenase subunit alpha
MPTVFVPRECRPGETRVAAVPETVKRLIAKGCRVSIESGAGGRAGFTDESYVQAGAALGVAWGAELVLKVQPPTPEEARTLSPSAIVVSFVVPSANPASVAALCERGVTAFALDLVPRISRAQSMDALSSQATVAGYKAVLLGAAHMQKLCPLLMTAAGTVPPAKVVVFGAGVAGLMAIATARRLGARVEATDVRRAAKEQVESLGARFIDVPGAADMEGAGGYAKEQSAEFLERQRAEVARRVAEADLVITTAQVPGKRAPLLVSADMVRSMRRGAVIVDLAAESGGNCELSVPGQVVEREGVTIVGLANLPATVPQHASELYAKNVLAFVLLLLGESVALAPDLSDEVLAGALLVRGGRIAHAPTAAVLAQGASA